MIKTTVLIIASYLLGSIPFGFITARLVKKIDIRQHGSGNIGATNVFRVVGRGWGRAVFVCDFLKGVLAPLITVSFIPDASNTVILLSAVAVVCGHNWTIFLNFKGGKGVATTIGAMAGLGFIFPHLWTILVISLVGWIVIFKTTRYVSIASMGASGLFFLLSLIFDVVAEVRIFSLLLLVFIVIRHKSNIKNLIAKKEHRF
jgi:glycerol-3-phosphate acyltransferase PlsY